MAADEKTASGHVAGTIQMRSDAVGDHAAPVMATVTGDVVPTVAPPSIPPPRYELGEEIARGGMGRVVEATDTLLGRVVALKEALALDADALRRFARETKITARLEHPSIVPVHDAGTMAGGAPFYVMRKVSGRPLERLVATGETLNQRLALLPHVVAAAQAIAHAHARGIVHRDIKPSNILVGELGETIVIDWGLAKVIGEADESCQVPLPPASIDPDDTVKTRAGIVYGTPGFMAPEQLRGATVNERCDVYALGATLYHLLSRKPPHHAKTADEMMKAAANAPPTPIGELVSGVPPELSTIIDKALAHDPRARYQNARLLAEDLHRFLTGQLVASHRYSPRERLLRFVRKHRVPVVAVGAAVVALLVIGTLAVTRVIGERDRADASARVARHEKTAAEEQKRRAEDRTEKLVLQQARSKVTSNPTEAVAMIKPLATKQWREVRSIAAAARVAGVAWSLPAPNQTKTLEMSRDGQRVLVAGDDGSVRIYDLVQRAARRIIEHGPAVSARFADSERKIVVWAGTKLAIFDAKTGTRTSELTTPTAIHDLEIVGVHAYWVDEPRGLWQLDLAGKVPLELAVDERLEQISPSPDGRWIALRGEAHLMLHDRTQPAAPAVEVLFGKTRDLDWADDGSHLVALVELGEPTERQVVDIAMTSVPQIIHRIRVGNRQFAAYSNERMFTIGPMGVGVASRNETTPRKQLVGDPVGLRESIDGVIVAGSHGGIALLTDDGDHSMSVPTGRLDIVEASARSPYVVGMTEGRMLVWNLSDVLPRRLATRAPILERFVGNDRVLASYIDTTAEWIDLTTRKKRQLEAAASALLDIVGAPDGRAACVIDVSHHARLIMEGHDPEDLGMFDIAVFTAANQLLLGTLAGTITSLDLQTKQRTVLLTASAKLVHMTSSRATPAWVAAALSDGTLWRMNLASGIHSTTKLAGIPTQILVEADGTVVFPDGRQLRVWRTSGRVEPLVELPKPILRLGVAGPARAVAFADDDTGYVVALDVPTLGSPPFDVGTKRVAMSPDTGLMVMANRGSIEVFDPLVPHRWTLASSQGLTFNAPLISNDGRHVLARRVVTDKEKRDIEAREVNTLLLWRLVMPATADETSKWLDQMTNAILDPQTNNLVWP